MSSESTESMENPQEAFPAFGGNSLPARLASLIAPAAAAARAARISKRLTDEAGDSARRIRCAEIIANHLLLET